ncbi:NlpC/P60 family protein [Zhenpiania hominis]|uniref:NlpC/P60 family protein n=1 Tax=Zhenpiania hominis TaxID=2763644 RepID=UPI0039F565D8
MEKLKKLKFFEHRLKVAVIGLAVVVVILGICSFLQFTEPYAVAEDGTKVQQPWSVKIGDKEEFVVATKEEGEKIIEQVKANYTTEDTNEEVTTVSPEITVTSKELERGDENPILTESEDAVAEVVAANETEEPLVTVTTTETVSKTKAIDYKTEYKVTDELQSGEKEVVKKGKKGKKTVVSEVVKENGKIVSKEVVSSTVEKKPVTKVVETGSAEDIDSNETSSSTASAAASSSSADSSQSAASGDNSSESSSDRNGDSEAGSASGQAVVDYALQFVGNPYVYGGSSLTNGTDCSGFTMSVYAHFGYSLPHSSSAQRSCGRGVSYSEAQPGDIICYSGHVGIYIGNGQIVHASTPSSGIKVSSATYKSIITVRRIID